MPKLLEICVDSYASALAAISGGADRLELCSALAAGGLTPSPVLLSQIRRVSDIPIRCLMRPRPGDFLYSPAELAQMALEIPLLRQAGADGFVLGCLTPEGTLDDVSLAPLLEAARGTGLTLHRCIDVSRDPLETYASAAKLGFDTVLTSGAATNCLAGMDTIAALLALRAEDSPEVLIGAGVTAPVISAIRTALPDARAFHMSGKQLLPSAMRFRREGVPMGLPGLDEWHIQQTARDAVVSARNALDAPI